MDESLRARPDTVLHPGEHLKDLLDSQGMSQVEFAVRAGISEKHVSQIVGGKAGITAEMALAIERVLGGGAGMWVNLDASYRLSEARRQHVLGLDESVDWAGKFPLADLRKRGLIKAKRLGRSVVEELFTFFGVAERRQWDEIYGQAAARYRQSQAYAASPHAQATYLRICEIRAELEELRPFDKAAFEEVLRTIRARLSEDPVVLFRDAREQLRQCGVALVAEPSVAHSRLSGAAFWPRRNRAILALTGRFKTADHLWFSFFHESAHLLLHGKRDVLEVDDGGGDLEQEADSFAREMLLPAEAYGALVASGTPNLGTMKVVSGAHQLPLDSLIGMLQHNGYLEHSAYRELKRPVEVISAVGANV